MRSIGPYGSTSSAPQEQTREDTRATPDAQRDNNDDVRSQLARLASTRRRRVVPVKSKLPCKWWPHRTLDPNTGMPFTDEAAWNLVVQLLESGHPIEVISLRIPSGRKGYVLKYTLSANMELYVKLQLGAGYVIGRSFHDSQPEDEEDAS
jgi:hypothetical protein